MASECIGTKRWKLHLQITEATPPNHCEHPLQRCLWEGKPERCQCTGRLFSAACCSAKCVCATARSGNAIGLSDAQIAGQVDGHEVGTPMPAGGEGAAPRPHGDIFAPKDLAHDYALPTRRFLASTRARQGNPPRGEAATPPPCSTARHRNTTCRSSSTTSDLGAPRNNIANPK